MIETWKVTQLRADPANRELFDDVKGEEYEALVKSIKAVGLINPLTITPTGLILCGHQRFRALKSAHITTALVTVRAVADDDENAKNAIRIEEQMRRRQLSSAEAMRVVRIYYRIHDIKQGSNAASPLREKLSEEYGIAPRAQTELNRIATSLIAPFLSLFEQERMTRTIAYQLAQLTGEEQQALLETVGLGAIEEATLKQVAGWRKEIDERDKRIAHLTGELAVLEQRLYDHRGEADGAEDAARKDRELAELSEKHAHSREELALLKESFGDLIAKTQALETQVAEADRLTRFADNNNIHRWLKGSQVLMGVTPAEYAEQLKRDPAISDFVSFHRERAMDAHSWLERYIACLDETEAPEEAPQGIRRLR